MTLIYSCHENAGNEGMFFQSIGGGRNLKSAIKEDETPLSHKSNQKKNQTQ